MIAETLQLRPINSAKPIPATAIMATSRGEPNRRADMAKGVLTPTIAKVANGTPPNGQFHLKRAARARAAGKTTRRDGR